MTSPLSAADAGAVGPVRRGFTLVELLVVIGILVLLIAITMAFVGRAQRQAEVTKAKAELNAISAGIEQFKVDHGFYPMAADPQPVLAEAMLSPGNAKDVLKLFPSKEDGIDGPGFKVNGKVWQPYLPADAYLVEYERPQLSGPARGAALILDRYDNPIVYLPKRKNLPPQSFPLVQESGTTGAALYDTRDGKTNRTPKPNAPWELKMVQVLLGDENTNNVIDPTETITNIPNFILASPGPDREFTKFVDPNNSAPPRQRLRKSDDVFNIEP